jgi:hypothetical protein
MNRGVGNKGVDAAVPGDVDKAGKALAVIRADVQQASLEDGHKVAPTMTGPRRTKKLVQLSICHHRADAVDDFSYVWCRSTGPFFLI